MSTFSREENFFTGGKLFHWRKTFSREENKITGGIKMMNFETNILNVELLKNCNYFKIILGKNQDAKMHFF